MCEATCSESGQLLTIKPCGWYVKLQSDRDRLAGVVAGMEDQGQRNLDALRLAEAENDSLRFRVDTNRTGLMVLDQRVESLESENARMREALKELHALVWGECPSLLNEDSGGDSRLDLEIEDCLGNALKEVG